MHTNLNTVVTPKEFDSIYEDSTVIAEFTSPKQKDKYERRDSSLLDNIRSICNQHFGSDETNLPNVVEDWWADHSKHIDITQIHLKRSFLDALQQLLHKYFDDYRIKICAYRDEIVGTSYIGSMILYSNRLVVEEALNNILTKEIKMQNKSQ